MIPRNISRGYCARKVLLNLTYSKAYTTKQEGPNHAIIELLNQHKEQEDTSPARNPFKVRAFQSAIKVINQLDHPLRSVEEARSLKGIGGGISQRIELYLTGQNYKQNNDPKVNAETLVQQKIRTTTITALQLVPGIGPAKARQLVDAGCMDISTLRQPRYQDMLSAAQKIGVKYFSHLEKPVTRQESENAVDFIRDNISSKFQVQIGGSYRRGHPTSSDIDVILFHPCHVHIPTPAIPSPTPSSKAKAKGRTRVPFATKSSKASLESSPLIQDVIKPLEERGFLAASLSSGARRWQGIILLPVRENGGGGMWEERRVRLERIERGEGEYRRMDINLVPMKSRGAALLALTGDTEFNRDIRTHAINLGFHLNEFGLWRWQPDEDGHNGEVGEEKGYWELVKAETEAEILREVGMEWVEPEKRNFGFVVGRSNGKGKGRPKV